MAILLDWKNPNHMSAWSRLVQHYHQEYPETTLHPVHIWFSRIEEFHVCKLVKSDYYYDVEFASEDDLGWFLLKWG